MQSLAECRLVIQGGPAAMRAAVVFLQAPIIFAVIVMASPFAAVAQIVDPPPEAPADTSGSPVNALSPEELEESGIADSGELPEITVRA